MWDAIVIGSGISGPAAGAALSRAGKRALLLKQHMAPGGQPQTYRGATGPSQRARITLPAFGHRPVLAGILAA